MFFWNHKKRLSHLNSFVRSDREISELVPQSPSPIIVNVGSSPVGSITSRTACQLEAAHVTIFSCIQRMKLYFKSKYVVFLKFRHCCFFTKFWNYTNSKVLISNMTILFSNSGLRIPKSCIFGPKFRYFCFFEKFCKEANFRVLISNMTIFF